jgi:hypothetical protein
MTCVLSGTVKKVEPRAISDPEPIHTRLDQINEALDRMNETLDRMMYEPRAHHLEQRNIVEVREWDRIPH